MRRLRWPLRAAFVLGFLELLSRQYIARPNRILRRSADPDMVYENTPGNWIGHAKYDTWAAPVYMVLDMVNTGPNLETGTPPFGYTLYRIDEDGCRTPSTGPAVTPADVLVLGSSQTFGLFVPAEKTVPAMLEKQLQDRGFPGVRAVNCGVIGHHFIQTLRTGEIVRQSKRPKLIVQIIRPWHLLWQFDYTNVLDPKNPAMKWLTHTSSFARAIFYYSSRQPNQFASKFVPDDVLEAKIDQYKADMAEGDVRSIFFLLDDQSPECVAFDGFHALLKRKGLVVERISTPSQEREYFVDKDRHWSEKGAAHATAAMIDAVARELALTTEARGPGAYPSPPQTPAPSPPH